MHELSPTLAKYLKLAYLFLPLGLAALAGLCLLLAALRKSLSGGTALALGGLAGIIVTGSLWLGAHNLSATTAGAEPAKAEGKEAPAPAVGAQPVAATPADGAAAQPAADAGALPKRALKIATIGYVVLPLGLAVLAGLTLVIATAGRAIDGANALALGGLSGVVVLGSVFSLRDANGANLNPLAAARASCASCTTCAACASGEPCASCQAAGGASSAGGVAAAPTTPGATEPAPRWQSLEEAERQAALSERAVESVSTGLEKTRAEYGEKLRTMERENQELRTQNGALTEKLGQLGGELKATQGQVQSLLQLLHQQQPDPRGTSTPPSGTAPAPAPQPGPGAAPGGPGG